MKNMELARKIAEESFVLLKNEDHILPLKEGCKAAFFGRAQIYTVFSGNGSGASKASKVLNILQECEKQGICAEPELKKFYVEQAFLDEAEKEHQIDFNNIEPGITCGLMYEIFGKYHPPVEEYEIPETLLEKSAKFTDTAILVLGRNSGGEECDRYLEKDYYLTDSEKKLLTKISGKFKNIIVILNVNGLVDLSWTEQYENIKGILFIGICGEQGGPAVAKILRGEINPSGKLPITIAKKYEDYPSAKHFSWEKENPDKILTYSDYGLNATENGSVGYEKSPVTVYWEDIYLGYRYFDTFEVDPLYPFGYGLSYSKFELKYQKVKKEKTGITIVIQIKNTSEISGREVVQVYLTGIDTKTERAHQELKGFAKTGILKCGEIEEISITIPWKEFASYQSENAAYVIEKGTYYLTYGNSSKNTIPAITIKIKNDIPIMKTKNRLEVKKCNKDQIKFLSKKNIENEKYKKQEGKIIKNFTDIEEVVVEEDDIILPMDENRVLPTNINALKNFSVEELASLCVGYGPGIPFSAFSKEKIPNTFLGEDGEPLTTNSHPTGMNGYISPAMEEKGILSVAYKDGPSGIGEIAWPSEMLLACSFDRELWYQFGDAIGQECETNQIDIWLAPAVNLHRNPLCGRNFEYFSEDPYLTGICGCEIAKGVQENHKVLVCPKHFAANEQETFRRGSSKKNYDAADSIITERAIRELYLKPFEMLVRDGNISCIMTSFNKINGVFSGGNKELCTEILREEWKYEGIVVTDWGDMDVVVDGADAVMAGNDIVMPGGPPVIKEILKGYNEGRVTRKALEIAVCNLLKMLKRLNRFNK